ncbi:MAG: TIGR02147 family protein [Fibrobacteres bacterium]|nr:TIGR02147 family protein [Fibrobacterota bacterium]
MKPIYEYSNYRKYLSDYYQYQKEAKPFFSFRYFSKRAGFQAPQMLKYVMDGQRNITDESMDKFILALNLKSKEADYFRALVHFNQAKTEKEKNRHFQLLLKFGQQTPIKTLTREQYEICQHWYYIPIKEMVSLKNFREDSVWISKRLNPSIKPAEALKALETLKKLGILKYDDSGKLIAAESLYKAEDEIQTLFVRRFHSQMIKLAEESIERIPAKKREISSVTISIPESEVSNIKALISAFEEDLLEMISKNSAQSETVYQLNFQFFPLVNTELSEEVKA